ncbi:MAG: hypothetical protein HON32_07430 [Francisellaceae bacterium]|nr:hypothetical protein [Francisellaceae bacterium]
MLTYLARILKKLDILSLRSIFRDLLPVYCWGCKLASDNNKVLCNICAPAIVYLQERCWVCCSILLEERENIYCMRCVNVSSRIEKSYGLFVYNSLINRIILNGVYRTSILELNWLRLRLRKIIGRNYPVVVIEKKSLQFLKACIENECILLSKSRKLLYLDEVVIFVPILDTIAKVEKIIENKIDKNKKINILFLAKR